jgi:hypothetical protein
MQDDIRARFESDFAEEFAQVRDASKLLDQRHPASAAAEPTSESAQQLSFAFAIPGSDLNPSSR